MRSSLPLAALLVACGASHGPPDAGSFDAAIEDAGLDAGVDDGCLPRATDADLEVFETWIRRMYCARTAACVERLVWPDVETCMRHDSIAWYEARAYYGIRRHLLRSGAHVLDREGLEACVAQESRRECRSGSTLEERVGHWVHVREDPRCRLTRPRCPGDGECWWPRQGCGDAEVCVLDDDPGCGPGRCTAPSPGEACEGPWDFFACPLPDDADGALCARPSEAEPHRCYAARLEPAVGEGAPCGPQRYDDVSVALVPCEAGLVCVPSDPTDRSSPRACWRPRRLGEACASVAPSPGGPPLGLLGCGLGLLCRDGLCVAPEPIAAVEVGAPCATEADEAMCRYQRWTECLDGACVEAGRAEGQPCDSFTVNSRVGDVWASHAPCGDGMYCDGVAGDGVCRIASQPNGGRCDARDDVCLSGCCDWDAEICVDFAACAVDPCGGEG